MKPKRWKVEMEWLDCDGKSLHKKSFEADEVGEEVDHEVEGGPVWQTGMVINTKLTYQLDIQ